MAFFLLGEGHRQLVLCKNSKIYTFNLSSRAPAIVLQKLIFFFVAHTFSQGFISYLSHASIELK